MKTSALRARPKAAGQIDKVLLAVDLSKRSQATALFAAEVAKFFGANLVVVHVFPPEPNYEFTGEGTFRAFEKRRHKRAMRLDRLTQKVRQIIPKAESMFLVGDPAEEISTFAYDADVDLIVAGCYNANFLGSLFYLGQTIQDYASSPLLGFDVQREKEFRSSGVAGVQEIVNCGEIS